MVSQNIEDNAASLPSEPNFEQMAQQMDQDGDFEDSTPPDVDVQDQPVATEAPAPGPRTEPDVRNLEQDQVAEPAPSVDTPQQDEPAAQSTKLTDIPEFRDWQSRRDKEVAELQQKLNAIESERVKAQQAQQVEGAVEQYLRREEQAGLAQGLNEDEVRNIVRTPERVQQVRTHFAQQLQMQQYEQTIDMAGRHVAAQHYAAQYNVAPQDAQLLLSSATPQAMEALAQRLGNAAQQRASNTQQQRSRVPAETTETAPVSVQSNAPAQPGFWELLDSAYEKPYDEMSADERRAVDMVASGRIPE